MSGKTKDPSEWNLSRKRTAVLSVLRRGHSEDSVCVQYNLDIAVLQQWIAAYFRDGDEGLQPSANTATMPLCSPGSGKPVWRKEYQHLESSERLVELSNEGMPEYLTKRCRRCKATKRARPLEPAEQLLWIAKLARREKRNTIILRVIPIAFLALGFFLMVSGGGYEPNAWKIWGGAAVSFFALVFMFGELLELEIVSTLFKYFLYTPLILFAIKQQWGDWIVVEYLKAKWITIGYACILLIFVIGYIVKPSIKHKFEK